MSVVGSVPPGYFEVMFAVPKKSQYRSLISFTFFNQCDYLYYGDIDDERTNDVRELVDHAPGKFILFRENPLEEDCYLHSITYDDSKTSYYAK